jgi:hypothetical protein
MKLKPLPYTTLNSEYALILDSGKVKHYGVSLQRQLTTEGNPLVLILDQIKKDFGPDALIEVVPSDQAMVTKTVAELAEISFYALLNPQTLSNLTKLQVNGQLHQYKRHIRFSNIFPFTLLLPLLTSKFIYAISRTIRSFCVQKVDKVGHDDWNITYRSRAHELLQSAYTATYLFFLDRAQETYVRECALVRYLTVVCEEADIDQAITQLANDLNILDKELTVMGNLKKFNIIPLVNTVGSGGQVYALLTFPVVKGSDKYLKMKESELFETLAKKGIKGLSREGGVSYLNGKAPYSHLLLDSYRIPSKDATTVDSSVIDRYADPIVDGLDGSNMDEIEAAEKELGSQALLDALRVGTELMDKADADAANKALSRYTYKKGDE